MNTCLLQRSRAPAILLITLALIACGGGGGGGGNGPPNPPAINITTSILVDGTVGVPFNQTIAASGGTGARSFSVSAGALPAGLALNASNGVLAGTPAGPAGTADFTVRVEDSASPRQNDTQALSVTINPAAVGRNDSVDDATPIGNGTYAASISPSGDADTFDPDEDYYQIRTTAASTVTVDINAVVNGSPLDSVIEIVSASGVPLTSCDSPAFNSICQHDDEDTEAGLLDSILQVRVPANTTFYVHVVDWGSNARPDKLYDLVISGVN